MPDSTTPVAERAAHRRRRRVWPWVVAGLLLALLALIVLWNWDWFIPLVEARAGAVLGRRVTMQHLHVRPGRTTTVTADGVEIANPQDFPQAAALARLDHLTVAADVMAFVHGQGIVLKLIELDRPRVAATRLDDGRTNFSLSLPAAPSGKTDAPAPRIGTLRILHGTAHVVDEKLRSDFTLAVATREGGEGKPATIEATAEGKHGGQKVTGRFVGGALLTLRDPSHPYPVDLRLANGTTHVTLKGTLQNPLAFAGADLKLSLAGTDMSALFPLTGVPIPPTPPYRISGRLDYVPPKIRFSDLTGRVGSSDLNGTIEEDPGIGGTPDVTMDVWSRRVDLADLGGLVGTPPGKVATPGQTAGQKRALAKAEAKKTLLPDTLINLPKLRAANVHAKYRGEHIENRYTPFDDIVMVVDLVDGRLTLHPVSLAVGKGRVAGTVDVTPDTDETLHARADIKFQRLDLARIMKATEAFTGSGTVGGAAVIDARGTSLADLLGHGNGELKLALLNGGNLSALLVDLSGLQFGNALLSALGMPDRARIECFVVDMPIRDGLASTRVLLLDTDEGRITGDGTVNFRDQTLDYTLTTRSKHFSVGALPGPIHVYGPLGDPGIGPGAETMARAGAAAGLGILLTPLGALLPTIQFGVGEDNACTRATAQEKQPLRVPKARRPRR